MRHLVKNVLLLQDGATFDVKFKLKNPRTDNFLWQATVITVGHKDFCDTWRENAWVKLIEANGDMGFVHLVPVVDPDLTLYDNVNQVFLNGDSGSQGVKRKLHGDDRPGVIPQSMNKNSVDHFIDDDAQYPVLDPQDVSECLGDMQNENTDWNRSSKFYNDANLGTPKQLNTIAVSGDQVNCGALNTSQVIDSLLLSFQLRYIIILSLARRLIVYIIILSI